MNFSFSQITQNRSNLHKQENVKPTIKTITTYGLWCTGNCQFHNNNNMTLSSGVA